MALPAPMQTDSSFERSVAEFIRTGRAVFDLPHPPCIQTAIDGFLRLITDPKRGDWSLFIPRRGEHNDEADDGLIRRSKSYASETTDNKWFFHYRPSLRLLLRARGVSAKDYEEMLVACEYLFQYYENFTRQLAEEFDQQVPNVRLSEKMQHDAALAVNVLRLLAYDPGDTPTNTDHVVARPHTDRDCITVHIDENRPGLHLGQERVPYIVRPGKALAFAGKKLERLTRSGIPAVIHDVQDPHGTDPVGRWSMVFFSHIPGSNGYL
jgi:hypothetical protein